MRSPVRQARVMQNVSLMNSFQRLRKAGIGYDLWDLILFAEYHLDYVEGLKFKIHVRLLSYNVEIDIKHSNYTFRRLRIHPHFFALTIREDPASFLDSLGYRNAGS